MKRVLIIGGTRGMGLGLACAYAREGADVVVVGRDPTCLSDAAGQLGIRARQGDVTDPTQIQALVCEVGAEGLDRVIYSAGYYATSKQIQKDHSALERMRASNVAGIQHVFDAAMPLMRPSGRFAAIASIAGLLRADPWSTDYAASKRAAIALCEGYRVVAALKSVGVTVLIPGYVDTAQLRALNGGSAAHKPFLVSEARAVKRMHAALENGEPRCVFPWQLHTLVRLYNHLPVRLRALRA
jgi:NAD(P)-dependent dehydrogenase (short-subunit alcohol dehydrogenase family)